VLLPSRRPPPLTVAEVLTWADAHRASTGDWPNARAAAFIPDAPLGTSWLSLQAKPAADSLD
jgi:hypothetical protein